MAATNYCVLYILVVPHTGSRAGVQRAGNSVGCEGKAEKTSYPCSCTGVWSWTTKLHHQEPLSDQSKERHGCPGVGMATLGFTGVSWHQGWGWEFLGPLTSVPFQIWISPLPEEISTPSISQGLGETEQEVLSKVFPFPSKVKAPGVPGRDLAATGMCGNPGGFRTGLRRVRC